MLTIEHQISLAETRPVPFTPKPIVDGAPTSRPSDSGTAQAYTHRYAGPQQNGRLPVPLGGTSWHVRWSAPISSAATAVLRGSDRILVEAAGWQLFAADGKALGEGAGRSSVALDPSSKMFYVISPASYLEARSLKDGELVFQSPLLTNERFAWPLLARFGNRLLMFGVEMAAPSHVPRPGTRSEIDMLEFSSPLELDVYKQILSLSRGELLHFDRAEMVFAAGAGKFFAAARNYLIVGRTGLEVDAVYGGDFKPIAISVDDAGYVYAIVETGGTKAYWVISPEGKRVLQVNLAPEHQAAQIPPVVAHNHQSYLLTRSVLAFGADGKLAWTHPMPGSIAGASVTRDDKLLVAAGSDLIVLDSTGKQIGAQHFQGEQLLSAPVLTAGGDKEELLIATTGHLYCLVRN